MDTSGRGSEVARQTQNAQNGLGVFAVDRPFLLVVLKGIQEEHGKPAFGVSHICEFMELISCLDLDHSRRKAALLEGAMVDHKRPIPSDRVPPLALEIGGQTRWAVGPL